MPYTGLPDRYGDFSMPGRPDRRERFGFKREPFPAVTQPPAAPPNPNANEKVWSPPTRPMSCRGVRRNGAPPSQSHMGTFGKFPIFQADPIDLKIEAARARAQAQRALRGGTAFKPTTNDLEYRLSKNAANMPAFAPLPYSSIAFRTLTSTRVKTYPQ